MTVQINEGTQTTVNTVAVGGTETQVVRLDIGAGTVAGAFTGSLANIGAIHTAGTLSGGSLANVGVVHNAGTIASVPAIGARHADAFATVISSGTSTLGTVKPAVSGSAIYVTDLIVSAGTATNVTLASGGTSTPILGTLHLATNGGAVMNFVTPPATASGSALVYKQSTDGPLTITCQGYVD